MGGLESKQGWG